MTNKCLPLFCFEVCHAISGEFCEDIMSTPVEGQEMVEEWVDKCNFPNCCSTLDGKHVAINKPKSGTTYHYNYKAKDGSKRVMIGFFNVDYKFMSSRVPLETMHIHDKSIFMNSDMCGK